MAHFQIKNRKGFSLVEVLLASVIFGIFVATFVSAYLYGEEATMLAGNRARATFLAEEGVEAVRNIRDAGFSNLTDGVHGISTSGNQWSLSGSQDVNGIFTRTVTVAPIDSKRKNVTVNVTWQQNAQRTGTVSLVSRLTNWIVAGVGNWANPTQAGSADISGTNNAIKIQVSGNYAYLVLSGGSPNFRIFDVSNPSSPSAVGSLTISGTPINIFVSGGYAYVVTNSNTQELQIVNISNPASPSIVGIYDAPGNADTNGVYVVGSTAYLARTSSTSDELVVLDVTNKNSPTLLGSLNLNATGYEVVVSGNYAYVASGDNGQELQVVNVSVPTSPTPVGSLNLSGNTDAITIALVNNTVLLGQGSFLYTINVSTPTSPSLLGSMNTSDTLRDIALNLGGSETYVYLATGSNSTEFQVADISSPSSPTLIGSVNVSGNDDLYGVAYDPTLDSAFGVGASNTEELVVFTPQ